MSSNVAVIDPPAVSVSVSAPKPPSLVAKLAAKYSVDAGKFLSTLKQTAFRQREGEVTNEQMMALLVVADQYGLNPFTKEIFAFPDKNNVVVPVVGVDGWSRIINEHPQFDGIEFAEGASVKDGLPEWIEAVIYRKDRSHATRVREYMVECKRGTPPWASHPRRMLRHKAMVQCARVAFSFVGIYDEDEADRMIEAQAAPTLPSNDAIAALNAQIALAPPPVKAQAAQQAEPAQAATATAEPAPVKAQAAQQAEPAQAATATAEPAPAAPAADALTRQEVEIIDLKVADFITAIGEAESPEDVERLHLAAGALHLTDEQSSNVARAARDRLARIAK